MTDQDTKTLEILQAMVARMPKPSTPSVSFDLDSSVAKELEEMLKHVPCVSTPVHTFKVESDKPVDGLPYQGFAIATFPGSRRAGPTQFPVQCKIVVVPPADPPLAGDRPWFSVPSGD